ncbi:MAG: hypothetical protein HY248_00550, partial [Fimbriimonas ginsengisoli]|nr:hypothetical protein [Fimbriimonas ginsengisoli]
MSLVDEKKLIGIVPIGIIESARFITNKYRVSRFAELGMPHELGQLYTDGGVTVNPAEKVPMVLGSPGLKPYNFYANPPTTNTIDVPQGASIYSNADLRFHSKVTLNLARPFGEGVFIAGTVVGADENAAVTLRISDVLSGVWQPPTTVTLVNTVAPSLDSRSNDFDTLGGLIRDGQPETDPEGFARAVGRKEPPSILSIDPNTGRNRYEELTRESGKLVGGGNDGRFGHGQGPYVDNLSDRQTRSDENGRIDVGAAESLQYDWLNPNNGQANSGWQGQYYVPRAAYLQLFSDGFTITRDSRDPAAERTWKNPDGSDTGNSACRFKVGKVGAGTAADPYRLNVVNSFTPGIDIDNPDYTLGQPFNGVVYFEGNVRVRGVIPTDVQMSVVSGATIYIEGSITKGVVGNDWSGNPNMLLERRSNSCLALLAKDYVAINTTQFFGPNVRQQVEEAKTTTTPG